LTASETGILRWQAGKPPVAEPDSVAIEEPLAIRVDGKTLAVTMRTPGHDGELAAGFLLSEALVRRAQDLALDSDAETPPNTVDILLKNGTLDLDKLSRHVFTSSSCGLCGKTSIDRVRLPFPPVKPGPEIEGNILVSLPDKLRSLQPTFARTGGLHAAAAFTLSGECLAAREDIGRHNAVDKILGWGLLSGRVPFSRAVLVVSGRASFEILQKALAGGFPIVASVSAPSSLAVAFAKESGQTLAGFVRGDRMNVYAGESRIKIAKIS
jgi:FdhD protein